MYAKRWGWGSNLSVHLALTVRNSYFDSPLTDFFCSVNQNFLQPWWKYSLRNLLKILHSAAFRALEIKIFFNHGECIYSRHLLYINSEAGMVNESTYVKNSSNITILEHFYKWNYKILIKHFHCLYNRI